MNALYLLLGGGGALAEALDQDAKTEAERYDCGASDRRSARS